MSIKNFNNSFNNYHQRIGVGLYGIIWLQALVGFIRPQRYNHLKLLHQHGYLYQLCMFTTTFLFSAEGLKEEVYGFLCIGYLELQYAY